MKTIDKNENYTVYYWMTDIFGLKGIDKELFAIIYNSKKFTNSAVYLAKLTGYTRQSIIDSLKHLVKRGMIKRKEISKTRIEYTVNDTKLKGLI